MNKRLTAYVNGNFLPLDEATIHIEDRGFQFADGVYEVIACLGGNFLDIKPHLKRLEHSCQEIKIPLPCSLDKLESLANQLCQKNPFSDAMIYIQVTRGVAPRSHVVTDSIPPSLIMTLRELPAPSKEKLTCGASAITVRDFRWGRCDIKSIALLASVMGKQEAVANGVDETFWLDEHGHLLEGCATNAFAIIDGILVTHPLDHQVLGGIMRNMVLRLAKRESIPIQERAWRLAERGLSECMMSSTTNALLPVCQIDGKAIGGGKPGPIAKQIRGLILKELEVFRQQ
ncbi:MAG: aminotransferase class IV [Mariprofundaceae bacterium]